jgi:hypothetical protein
MRRGNGFNNLGVCQIFTAVSLLVIFVARIAVAASQYAIAGYLLFHVSS